MTAKELKEWLTDVPDNAEVVAAPNDEFKVIYSDTHESSDNTYNGPTYTVEPIFNSERVVFVYGC